MRKIIYMASALLVLASCNGRQSGQKEHAAAQYRNFPVTPAPRMVTDRQEALEYCLSHFWDAFFEGEWQSDTSCVLGVRNAELEANLATFITMADALPKDRGQDAFARLFRQMESRQIADSASHIYTLLGEMVVKYLYDPNSPYRDEDYYLPFVQGLAASPVTRDDIRPGYAFEAEMCALNRYGTPAADFKFKDGAGRVRSLHSIRAEYTVLFFSNPGCRSCKDIVDDLMRFPLLDGFIKDGRVAVLNIYIDDELNKWREYLPMYPSSWISGYDHNFIIRGDALYNVRAIPSLYLLDRDKRVLMKDVPTDKLINYLANI